MKRIAINDRCAAVLYKEARRDNISSIILNSGFAFYGSRLLVDKISGKIRDDNLKQNFK